ncbi:ChrR family anti-sigma-E factor [Alteromonas oceanisediminis]|uniref:ChrR family anti-sigma-E factor n=1 Tax=Alteromonas oceanisediminis TaxID=2836180 RepID=UPI001BDA8C47|nr:ChrR family anti-sigma-E factor [Alteromonas oceanisediminis]MBT0585835.1 ChrR family anti-sigma-E factor [Alteromonas oceanisediminis]
MIKYHPSEQQLLQFAEGTLPAAESLMLSAHCDMCTVCQERLRYHSENMAKTSLHDEADNPALDRMLANIIQQPEAERPSLNYSSPSTIELDGRRFAVPRALRRYIHKTGNWSSLVGKLWQAPVDLGDIGMAHFIYMEKGGRVPEHTHKGSELTLVINGEFSDGIADYDSGDFIAMNGSHTHAPGSDADEGCLVFSIVDKPLHFTSGLARLLNPFSHLFFK